MEVRIESIDDKKVVGLRINTCAENVHETHEMWGKFMPQRNDVPHRIDKLYYSIAIFDADQDFKEFTLKTRFDKWAAVEVAEFDDSTPQFEQFTLPGGQYAVFLHQGPAHTFSDTLNYIYGQWIPQSEYQLDPSRPRFEVLKEDYIPTDLNAQEEVWVAIK